MQTQTPKTLQEAIVYFSNPDNCREYLVARRWPNGVVCPTCGGTNVKFQPKHNRWQCASHHAKRQFTIKVGTIFEDSPIGLDKWLCAVWMIVNCKNGVSSYEIARAINVTQKSAWFMLHRIRLAMQGDNAGKLGGGDGGPVEIDETFIGGKARNMHPKRRAEKITGTGGKDKAVVVGMVERGGEVRAFPTDTRRKAELQALIQRHVESGSAIFTDELKSYDGLTVEYLHQVINHAIQYVNGNVHTNTMENFWSLLKRGIKGTYVSVEPYHLFRYLDEQAFRYNNRRNMNDSERFDLVSQRIVGKRIKYAELIGRYRSAETL